jgi:hypothetical protein
MTVDSTSFKTTPILFSNNVTGANSTLLVKYAVDATVGTFTGVKWPGGVQPSWTTGDTSASDLCGFFCDGTSLYGVVTYRLK